MPDVLSPAQRRTLPGREAFARKFSNPQEKSEHYRAKAAKANSGRVVLSGNESAALVEAYLLLARIAERARAKIESAAPAADSAADAERDTASDRTADRAADEDAA